MQTIQPELSPGKQVIDIAQLQAQVATLEELLQLYEQSAIEQEQRLQEALKVSQDKAIQLEHAQGALQTVQTILESMGDAVVVVDQGGHAIFTNPAAQRLLGDEPLDRPFYEWTVVSALFCADGKTPYALENWALTRALQGESVEADEIRVVSQAELPTEPASANSSLERNTLASVGEEPADTSAARADEKDRTLWLSVNAAPLQEEEQIIGAVAVFRDISQQKAFEQALRRSHGEIQQQAQQLEKALQELKRTQAQLVHGEKMSSLGQTVAGIAHEINNPVNFIHGNLKHTRQAFDALLALVEQFQQSFHDLPPELEETLEELDLPFLARDIPEMLGSMQTGTERIREIVKTMRLFSRLDEAEVKTVNIHQGLDSALLVLKSQMLPQPNRAGIKVHKHYGDLPLLECHAGQLNQVFVNLLGNAIDAFSGDFPATCDQAHPTPQITIRTKWFKGQVVIQVRDNGCGIPKASLGKIFDPFFTTKPVGQGTGLGLSVCYQIIVETHGGYLQAFSREGKGTQLVIKLPCRGPQKVRREGRVE